MDPWARAVLQTVDTESYDPREQDEIIVTFSAMLRKPTEDGGRKRESGAKIPWTIDPEHREALYRHLRRWETGERTDRDSGAHPLIHVAWRALALAYQETR
jgi:dATP/dGTP diphosphohydrolase